MCWQCGKTFHTDLDVCPNDGARLLDLTSEDAADPLIGTLFDGRFRIYKCLGEGGMGTVYSARRLDFDSDVALKLLKVDFARDDGIRKRFMYEARVISSLKHPHAVRLFDFGQTAEGSFYMVMELLHGESLADRLAYRFVTYREIFDILAPICGVLGEAHTKDVIHRDLKPENIFLLKVDGNKEFPKLLDFGIAKHIRAETMTQSGTLWGTPAYMSPEQARGDMVGARADIYGIGVMLYELVSGNLPFHASTQMGFAVKHINEPARPLSSIPGLRSVPVELDQFVMRLLAKNPEERPATMEEVASTLLGIRDRHFSDALLDSVPAEEVDPLGLQAWIKAADTSQQFPAVDSSASFRAAVPAPDRSTEATIPSPPTTPSLSADSLDASGQRPTVLAETAQVSPAVIHAAQQQAMADVDEDDVAAAGLGRRRGVLLLGAALMVLIAAAVAWSVRGSSGAEVAIDAESEVVGEAFAGSPIDMSNVAGVAATRAASVIIGARVVAAELERPAASGGLIIVDEPELLDEDGTIRRVRPERRAEPRRSGTSTSDARQERIMKRALENTF